MAQRFPPWRRTALALAGVVAGAAALAAADDTPELPIVRARLVSTSGSLEPGGADWIALHLAIRYEGWHVYWKNPGDSGTPPRLAWQLPDGVEVSELYWPAPRRFVSSPLASYAYEHEVYLPLRLSLARDFAGAGPLRIEARASWLACRVECIPESAELALELPLRPGGTASPTADAEAIQLALDAVPAPAAEPARIARQDDQSLWLEIALDPSPDPERFDYLFLPDAAGVIEPAADQDVEARGAKLTLRLAKSSLLADPVKSLSGVLIAEAKQKRTERTAVALEATAEPVRMGLPVAAALALAGGVLLNLMPCVFPVLAIKVLGFARHAATSRASSTLHALVFALGILTSFWVLTAVLLALRAGGNEIGWGFQLQSPPFVLALVFLFFAMGLVFLGAIEIGNSVSSIAGRLHRSGGYAGSFSSGVLATAIATPCTGPFMGAALGYALAAPPSAAFVVFTALALGMGLPYVALASSPVLLRALPRPGPWMETLRQLMAFPLLATVVWLLWVFARQAGTDALAVALAGLLVASFGFWVAGRLSASASPVRARWAGLIAVATLLAGFAWALPEPGSGVSIEHGQESNELGWIPYTAERLGLERQRGRPVYVDFTASWCLTCQVNKKVVFGSEEVLAAFREHEVILIRADWTDRDPEITRALARFGRSGVPLNVLYGDDPTEEPIVLSTVLTPSRVLAALEDILEQ